MWTGGDNRFFRHLSASGNSLAEFMGETSCTAEYDNSRQTLYIWGVGVGQPYYDAVLQFQNGRYALVSFTNSTVVTSCYLPFDPRNNKATFDLSNNMLSISSLPAANTLYTADFKYLGNNVFELQSATKF